MTESDEAIRLEIRCPITLKDCIYIVSKSAKAIRCKSCDCWHSLKELRSLRTDAFAPRFQDGTLHPGYIGAVRESEVKKSPAEFVVEYEAFVIESDRQMT